jgi:predicted phage gp36 major capsid-like protein
MIGIMQIGLFATVAEASPLYNESPQRIVQLDRHDHHDRDNDRRRQHDERLRRENERHEKEMRRRHHESEREWRERQRRENERHERELRVIAALLIGIAIGSSND